MITAPAPHHPDQTTIFPTVIDTTYGPLAMSLHISLHRTPRQKCAACGMRRITYFVGLGDAVKSPSLCAKCAGIR